jgi:hypothetical protein
MSIVPPLTLRDDDSAHTWCTRTSAQTGKFLSSSSSYSSSTLNASTRRSRNTPWSTLMDVPTDCPQRERRGGLGDASIPFDSVGRLLESVVGRVSRTGVVPRGAPVSLLAAAPRPSTATSSWPNQSSLPLTLRDDGSARTWCDGSARTWCTRTSRPRRASSSPPPPPSPPSSTRRTRYAPPVHPHGRAHRLPAARAPRVAGRRVDLLRLRQPSLGVPPLMRPAMAMAVVELPGAGMGCGSPRRSAVRTS